MADYSGLAGRALATVTRKGAAVTFTLASAGTYDATTDTYSSAVTTSTAGYAVRLPGDPVRYESLGLRQSEAATFLFAPTTYAAQPALGSTTSWDGVTYTVEDVDPIEPDGNAIVSQVICRR